ncbi:MAG: sporulation protein YunB [Clostridium sp.]|uniref:Sporulation protein YunB n=1 Tax=Clostridium paraputrificum TaxID=29363 RepID=A0A6N3BSV4_9CLOT|nr:sporulation protein YunB [Clostridium sp.]MBS5925558.1 sporulation protein YunB [Clostridium sp.]MBS5986203.1 sporulation protein YunB [Clostridium sp.]
MNYYTKPKKTEFKPIILVIISILLVFILSIFLYDKKIYPAVLQVAESLIKADTIECISKTSMELFDEEFNYDEMIIIDKDNEGNINMIRANTVKLNYLTSRLSIRCNEELQKMGEVGVEVPLGWMTDNSAFYEFGPDINVKLDPIGNMKVSYESKFESAGINQTRHKIYLNVEARVRMKIPLNSKEQVVTCQIPVAETIIVGKTPNTAIDLGGGNK